MGIKTKISLTALGDGTGLVIEQEAPEREIPEFPLEKPEGVASNETDDRLIFKLRGDLGYSGTEPEWVALSISLRRYMVRNNTAAGFFPNVINCLEDLATKGNHLTLIRFLELADEIPMEPRAMELFISKLSCFNPAHPVKSPLAVLTSLGVISPNNWREAIWYLDLIISVDLTMAELTSLYMEELKGKPEIYVYFLLQVARTSRLEAIDKFLELLPVMEKKGEDIGKEMEPIIDLINNDQMAEAEMLMMALKQVYGIGEGNLEEGMAS